jgi:5-methylcytosine-specific restriction endonuclease McrA
MPIRPENKARYPKDWPQISRAIRARAGQKCEKCAAPNGELVKRLTSGRYGEGAAYMLESGHIYSAEDGRLMGKDYPAAYAQDYVKVVLTVAHLDHQPENCDPANLRAWCQRCHNAYDAPMRRQGIKSRARDKSAIGDLLL